MAVIGAGVIGVELGSVYSRLGCHVQLFEFLETACPMLDRDLSRELQKTLEKQGMSFHFQTKVTQAQVSLNRVLLTIETAPQPPYQIEFDKVIVAVGRRPYSDNLGLEEIGIAKDQRGFISVDQNFRTAHSHIYAIGDLIGGAMLAHKASEEGIAVAEFLAGETPHISYATIPNVVYTHPEAASVGLTEKEAKEYGISYQTALFPLQGNSRAACMGETDGLFKLIVEKEKGMLLGAHLLSPSAGELIGQLALAIEKRMSIRDLSHLSFAHPTLAEGIKEAALGVFGSFLHL